jgi:hypothetical protein
MAGKNELDKVLLPIDGVFRQEGKLFGEEWEEVRRQQMIFLLERPLMFKVLTERVLGPERMKTFWIGEWEEVEATLKKSNSSQMIEELADMAILLLTQDSFNPDLSLPSQIKVLRMVGNETLREYCAEINQRREFLIPEVMKKIEINRKRNPVEAFRLVANEDMQTSNERMARNWQILKEKRGKMPKGKRKRDWWKQWLYVDEGGWIKEVGGIV